MNMSYMKQQDRLRAVRDQFCTGLLVWCMHPQIKQMEDTLRSYEAQSELTALRRKLELMEEEKRDYSDKCSKAEVEVKDLRFTGKDKIKLYRHCDSVMHDQHCKGSEGYNDTNRPLFI